MNILRLEFHPSEAGSYNDQIAQLIKKVRFFTTQIPAHEIKLYIPEAKRLELKLQSLDKLMDNEHRDYISEIMDALHAEAEIEPNFREELAWSLQTITSSLFDEAITAEDIDFDYMEDRNTYWVEFNGINRPDLTPKDMQMIKDIVKSVCYKCGILFVNCGE